MKQLNFQLNIHRFTANDDKKNDNKNQIITSDVVSRRAKVGQRQRTDQCGDSSKSCFYFLPDSWPLNC